MKVLFVFSIGKLHGGAAGVWLTLLDNLPKLGIEPCVVIPQDVDGSMTGELERRGIPWCEAFFTWWVTSDKNPRSLAHRIRRQGAKFVNRAADKVIGDFIEQQGVELVYICDGTITAGLKEAQRRGLPVVWHVHQFIRDAESGASFIDPEAHVRATFARADAIITVNNAIKMHLRQRFPAIRNITAIYNGITDKRIYDKPGILSGENTVFTYVGRFDENKRPYDALRAFMMVAPEFPQARLRFVGAGDEDMLSRMQQDVYGSGCASQVEFCGYVDDIKSVWKDADVVLNCSYSEGCSMVVGEAMASGCLLLCSTAEGNVEMLNSKYGLLYERKNVDALADQMVWVLENPHAARGIAARGKQHAARVLNPERQAEAVYQVFTGVLT